jgi:putative ABC transport system permease protein
LNRIDPGYRVDGLVVTRPAPVPGPTPRVDLAVYQHQLMDKISQLRGVTAVALSNQFPFATPDALPLLRVAVAPADPSSSVIAAFPEFVSPGFFKTVGMPMLVGRDFSSADEASQPRVVIMNKALAEQLFGSATAAVGTHIREAGPSGPLDLAVIGVVSNASPGDPRIQGLPIAYRSLFQEPSFLRNPAITVRVAEGSQPGDGVRSAVQSFGYNYVSSVRTVREQLDRSVLPERLLSLLSSFVGTLSALLSGLGIYALLSYNVLQRCREIGIRVALGATRRDIAVMIALQAARLAAGGLVIGVPLVWAVGRVARSLLFTSGAPLTIPSVVGSLVALTAVLIATAGPAIRASRVEPATALRGN